MIKYQFCLKFKLLSVRMLLFFSSFLDIKSEFENLNVFHTFLKTLKLCESSIGRTNTRLNHDPPPSPPENLSFVDENNSKKHSLVLFKHWHIYRINYQLFYWRHLQIKIYIISFKILVYRTNFIMNFIKFLFTVF